MTVQELREALEALSEEKFSAFVQQFGGDHKTPEQVVRAYVDGVDANPKLERRLCQLLGLRTEEEKRTEATLVAAANSKRSALAALISALIAALSLCGVFYFSWQDRQDRVRQQELERTANWEEAKEAMLEIIEKFPHPGVKVLRTYPPELKQTFMRDILLALSFQTSNPVLLEDRECLVRWRNAMSTAQEINWRLSHPSLERRQQFGW